MNKNPYNLLLADDDPDDCMFFREALDELPVRVHLTTVNDGVELMRCLNSSLELLPDLIFLDLNMPRKTGLECLLEIKENRLLNQLPIVIFSTSMDLEIVKLMYEKGAYCYIRKPGEFSQLKGAIHEALKMTTKKKRIKLEKEKFVIQV